MFISHWSAFEAFEVLLHKGEGVVINTDAIAGLKTPKSGNAMYTACDLTTGVIVGVTITIESSAGLAMLSTLPPSVPCPMTHLVSLLDQPS